MRQPTPALAAGSPDVRWDRLAVAAVLLGAVVRALFIFVLHPPLDHLFSDMAGYVDRARELAAGHPLIRYDAFYPPGTHMLLALPMFILGRGRAGLWGGAFLWWTFSSLAPLVTWRLARLLFNPAAGAVAAMACALYPLYVTYGGYFTSETPAVALLVGALWLAYSALQRRGRNAFLIALCGGLAAGAALGVRPQFALNFALLGVAALLTGWRRTLPVLAGLLAGAVIVLAGLITYSSQAAGRFTLISQNSALNFFLAQCPARFAYFYKSSVDHYAFEFPVSAQLHRGRDYSFLNRVPGDQSFLYDQGLKCLTRSPTQLLIPLRNVVDLTATSVPWPQSEEIALGRVADVTNSVFTVVLPLILALGIVGVRRRRRSLGRERRSGGPRPSGEAIMLMQFACVIPIALVYGGDPRFRVPYDSFVICLLAGLIVSRSRRLRVSAPIRAEDGRSLSAT